MGTDGSGNGAQAESSDTIDPDERKATFFVMPSNALKSLRDELEILQGEEETAEILEHYGFRCGEGMIIDMDLKCDSLSDLTETLNILWAEIGLGRPELEIVSETEIHVKVWDSVEARSSGTNVAGCDFTRGYLSGTASTLMGQGFRCVEDRCTSKGDSHCRYRLYPGIEIAAPASEKGTNAARRYDIDSGVGYLIEDETAKQCYDIFADFVTHGAQGLCITRDYPEKVRRETNLKKTPIVWLSKADKEYALEPEKLSQLYHQVETFLKRSEKPVLLLSGMEYLITHNSYRSVLKFIQLLNEQIAIHDATLLVPISPETLDKQDLKLLEREMVVFHPDVVDVKEKVQKYVN